MRKLRRSVFYAVIWVYLLGTSLSATHIHHQLDTPDHDCKVCLVVKNIHASYKLPIDYTIVFIASLIGIVSALAAGVRKDTLS